MGRKKGAAEFGGPDFIGLRRMLGQLDELSEKKLFKLSMAQSIHFRYTRRRVFFE